MSGKSLTDLFFEVFALTDDLLDDVSVSCVLGFFYPVDGFVPGFSESLRDLIFLLLHPLFHKISRVFNELIHHVSVFKKEDKIWISFRPFINSIFISLNFLLEVILDLIGMVLDLSIELTALI
jgi:hypothetical protein